MARTGVTVDKLTPEGKKFYQQLKELQSLHVKVGYQQGKKHYPPKPKTVRKNADGEAEVSGSSTPIDVCEIAATNEFGTDKIPSRPFMRQTADHKEGELKKFMEDRAVEAVHGRITAEEAFTKIGVKTKGAIQQQIRDGEFVPDSPQTIRRKGSDKPLIDTGRMRQSVDFFIEPKGEGDT